MNEKLRNLMILAAVLVAGLTPVTAAEPPQLINFQGVLRDAAADPLDGVQEMVFHLYDAEGDASCKGGSLLLTDRHSGSDSVEVSGGLFNTQIGAGLIEPGAAKSLVEVFRDYAAVFLEVQIEGEHLCPRVRVLAAGYALNAAKLAGYDSLHYLDSSATSQTKVGALTLDPGAGSSYGITSYGEAGGGYFADSNSSGYAQVGSANYGFQGYGDLGGGFFQDTNSSGLAYAAYGDLGIKAYGSAAGGSFEDSDGTGFAELGSGDYGIRAQGARAGGRFQDDDGANWAYLGYDNILGDYGIYASGESAGGYFRDSTGSGSARLGHGDVGITASGSSEAGYFEHSSGPDCFARLATGGKGVVGSGWDAGAFFTSSYPSDDVSSGYVGYAVGGDYFAFRGWGSDGGAWLTDDDSGTYTYVAANSSSTSGNGAKNFLQNHPLRSDQVIVYTALEGDEAGTYTRGTARLDSGRVRVALGETFRWVTNPDIGLTAQVTVRGEAIPIAVESLTTEELVVRGPSGSSAAFDFVVFGLRIGFEEASVVQEKSIESFIPSMTEHRRRYERQPELRVFNPLERFKRMATAIGTEQPVDLRRAESLRAAIEEYDREFHGPVRSLLGHGPEDLDGGLSSTLNPQLHQVREGSLEPATGEGTRVPAKDLTAPSVPGALGDTEALGGGALGETDLVFAHAVPMPVTGPVEPGDVLVFDPAQPGTLRVGTRGADPAVVGVAVASSERDSGSFMAPVALAGLVRCKVDAGFGAVRAGDLLTTSPTPGYAMRALATEPGTILGKAAAPLEVGAGTIKILVMSR